MRMVDKRMSRSLKRNSGDLWLKQGLGEMWGDKCGGLTQIHWSRSDWDGRPWHSQTGSSRGRDLGFGKRSKEKVSRMTPRILSWERARSAIFLREGQRRGCSPCGSVRKFLVLQVLSLGHCWEAVPEEIRAIARLSVPGAFCTLMKTTSGIRPGGPCL